MPEVSISAAPSTAQPRKLHLQGRSLSGRASFVDTKKSLAAGCLSKDSCGRGVISDAKATLGTWFVKEMTNPNLKTVAVSFFLYLACIAPAITFGAIYAKLVHKWMGAVEMILATAWCGLVYALVGGQPMMINGGTGPVLAFTGVLYNLSVSIGVPFLTLSAWIGLWCTFYMLVAAFFDLNRFMHLATRFTDEIFSGLISAIFIVNALASPTSDVGVFHYFSPWHGSHEDFRASNTTEVAIEWAANYSYLASALLSVACTIGTTYLALCFRSIKASPYFCNQKVRSIVTDFGVVASVAIVSLAERFLFPTITTETLAAPDVFEPTFQCCTSSCRLSWPDECPDLASPYGPRPWLVDLSDLNGKMWVPFFASVPAILAFVLVFLDNGITWHLINRPENKLDHGSAYNYDTVVIGLMVGVNSMLGLPWLVAATVRSINHVQAMSEKDQKTGKTISVQQTRLTHLGIHLLVLATIFAMSILRFIPMAVLYGVFLYMGLVSLGTNQFWERLTMMFMQPSKYPKRPHTEHVPLKVMHAFTAMQLGLFVLLYAVKTIKAISIAFPLVIAACIPVRIYLLPRLFEPTHLLFLDGDEDDIRKALEGKGKDEGGAQEAPVVLEIEETPAA